MGDVKPVRRSRVKSALDQDTRITAIPAFPAPLERANIVWSLINKVELPTPKKFLATNKLKRQERIQIRDNILNIFNTYLEEKTPYGAKTHIVPFYFLETKEVTTRFPQPFNAVGQPVKLG